MWKAIFMQVMQGRLALQLMYMYISGLNCKSEENRIISEKKGLH